MSTDRKIAWFGVLLSALGLIPIFRDANSQVIVAYCAAFASLVVLFLYAVFRTSGPQFTTVSLKKVLKIEDKQGQVAHLDREQNIRVHYGCIAEVWCREIYADGSIDNFEVDDEPIQAFDQNWNGPVVDLRKRFSEAVFSGHTATVSWRYRLQNSFPAKHEALDHEVTPGTGVVELIVLLPADRTCIRSSVHLLVGGEPIGQLDDPEISSDRRRIRTLIKRPTSGQKLRLSWDW
jgi:hypothetical protein